MRSGWTIDSCAFLVLSIRLLKFLRLGAYYEDKSPMPITIHRTKCSRSRPIARPSKPLDRWDTLFAIIDRSTAVLCIHALRKSHSGAPGMKGSFDPLCRRTGGSGTTMAGSVSSEQPGDKNQSLVVFALTSAGTQL